MAALRCYSLAIFKNSVSFKSHLFSNSISFQNPNSYSTFSISSAAPKSQIPCALNNNNKKNNKSFVGIEDSKTLNPNSNLDFEILGDLDDAQNVAPDDFPLPEPPTGFLVDDNGTVFLTSTNRLVTIVDPISNLPLECVIRRIFKSSEREECMLLCPVDTPVHILKSTVDGWSAISDEEVESILPAAAYALAKTHMHLVYSGYCYTARGGFCYTEEDILDFHTDDGKEIEGLPSEGVEITYFELEDTRYLIYTPSEPLLFVVVKDENGMFQMADDDLLDDPAVIDAVDEETEFNALVEEEAAFIEAMMKENESEDESENEY